MLHSIWFKIFLYTTLNLQISLENPLEGSFTCDAVIRYESEQVNVNCYSDI